MIEVILLLQAENDIQSAYNRYEDLQERRGDLFLAHLEFALGRLRLHPELGPVYRAPFRRLLIPDFPYGIFYNVQPTRIVVSAVLDLRKDPKEIRKRLS